MNDKEAIVNAFELYMDGLSNAYMDAAERTGYISVYSGEEPNDA